LSEADLRGAYLIGTYLSQANFAGPTFAGLNCARPTYVGQAKGVDLSEAILFETRFREEDLDGVKYRPEQIKDMIIERSGYEPLIIPEDRGNWGCASPQSSRPCSTCSTSWLTWNINMMFYTYISLPI